VSAVLSLAAILQLAATPDCTAPGMPPANIAAVARQESGFHPYAIRDETTDRSHYPATREAAEALAARLTAQGHLLGVGLMQLTPPANFGLSIDEAFDPCKNMKAGAELLAANYNLEWQALMRALSRYNSGSPTRAEAYAKRVAAQAQRNARMPSLALHPLPNRDCPEIGGVRRGRYDWPGRFRLGDRGWAWCCSWSKRARTAGGAVSI